MTKELKKENVTETATEKEVNKLLTKEQALFNAEKENRSFKLYRSWYHSEKKDKNYYSYNVYIRLFGTIQNFVKIELIPDIGYSPESELKSDTIAKNISAYQFMHLLYDMGNELRLFIRSQVRKDSEGNEITSFGFCAESNDGSVNISTRMTPRNKGARGFLEAGYVGFGKIRDITDEDIKEVPELAEEFKNVLFPGELPVVQIDSSIE